MELTIEKLIYGGDGLGRLPADEKGRGKAVFVPFTLPGEKVEIAVREEKPGFVRAAATRILEASPLRVEAPCPYFQSCGGCQYQHADYPEQLEIKAAILKENLRRLAKMELATELLVHASPPWNYRNRTRLQVRADAGFAVGYFKASSHELEAVETCPISSPLLNRAIEALCRLGRGGQIPQAMREVELFANEDDSLLQVELYIDPHEAGAAQKQALQVLAERLRTELAEVVSVYVFTQSSASARGVEGPITQEPFWTHGAGEFRYRTKAGTLRVGGGSFFQVNRFLVDELVNIVAGGRVGEIALDLYAGVGLFSAALAASFRHIVAVESSQGSAADLKYNSPRNVKAVRSTVDGYLAGQGAKVRPDLIVVDPPRAGLGERVARGLAKLGAPRVTYVSCDPATLARDIITLTSAGYRVEQVHLIDLFPQTYHIESVVEFVRWPSVPDREAVSPAKAISFFIQVRKPPRQPMLWAALAYALGILYGVYAWRPPLWWVVAAVTLILGGLYFAHRRWWLGFPCALLGLFAVGALTIQLRCAREPADGGLLAFAGDNEVSVVAHVIHGREIRQAASGELRQSIDVETEDVTGADQALAVGAGLRLGIYAKEPEQEYDEGVPVAMRMYHYGERVRFAAKLRAPRNFRNPGAFDYRGYLAERGIAVLASTKSAKVELLPGLVGTHWQRWRERVHRSIVRKIHGLWTVEDAALMDAAVIGESAFLTPATRVDFQRSGTYHILVVSGMNVSILAFVVFWVMRRFSCSDFLASALTVVLCTAYAFVTDVGPPVWRAVLMLTVYLGVRLVYRERSMLNALGAAALIVMVVDPKALLGASFQLTFLSVFIVAAIAIPVLERTSQPYLRGLRNLDSTDFDRTLPPRVAQMRLDLRLIAGRLAAFLGARAAKAGIGLTARAMLSAYELLCVSTLMQVGLALPMAYYFHRATVVGIPANALAVPLTGILMPAAVLAVALSYGWMPLAKAPALLAAWALHGITGAVRSLGGFRIADRRVAMPETTTVILAAVALAFAMALVWRRRALLLGGLAVLTVAGLWVSAGLPKPHIRRGMIELTAIDVGQGDSLLIVSPEGKTLLVDAGGAVGGQQSEFDFGENVVSPYLWERRISRLDVVAVTHGHSDHIGGLHAVLNNFRPQELWIGALPETPAITALLAYARSLGIRVVRHSDNESFEFGGMQVSVFSPPLEWHTSTQPRNNDSLVLRLRYLDSSVLLEGDAEGPVEQRMAAQHDLKSDLLKVAHHGSATSSTAQFVHAVHPQWAVISVGKGNSFGHPRKETLEHLQEVGAHTYRTDRNGAVTFYLDGHSVSPQLACLR